MIYATPFDPMLRECSGLSVDSGFSTLAAVIDAMGPNYITGNLMYVIYGDDKTRVIFSNNVKWKKDND